MPADVGKAHTTERLVQLGGGAFCGRAERVDVSTEVNQGYGHGFHSFFEGVLLACLKADNMMILIKKGIPTTPFRVWHI
jgi:hypothetical protein